MPEDGLSSNDEGDGVLCGWDLENGAKAKGVTTVVILEGEKRRVQQLKHRTTSLSSNYDSNLCLTDPRSQAPLGVSKLYSFMLVKQSLTECVYSSARPKQIKKITVNTCHCGATTAIPVETTIKKCSPTAWGQWLTPVIPATWEGEVGGSQLEASLGK
jgi:hypothetical protein